MIRKVWIPAEVDDDGVLNISDPRWRSVEWFSHSVAMDDHPDTVGAIIVDIGSEKADGRVIGVEMIGETARLLIGLSKPRE